MQCWGDGGSRVVVWDSVGGGKEVLQSGSSRGYVETK